jgi:putative peptidoglycan lipid II flippase
VLLATSTCISAAVNSFMLWRGLLRDGAYRPAAGWQTLLLRVLAANGAMALVLLWLAPTLESWIAAAPAVRALRLAGCIGAGALVYAAVLAVLGLRPAHLRNSSPRGESR